MTDPEVPGDPQPKGERDNRPDIDIDAAFAAIIADFATPAPPGTGSWPASEDLDDGGGPDDSGAEKDQERISPEAGDARADVVAALPPERWDPPARHLALPGSEPTDAFPATARRDASEDPADEEGYEPPDPPPFPRGDLVSRIAWISVIGGPAFLLLAALLWRSLPTLLLLLALIAFIGGFVTLVARMPQDHPDDPDHGAVV